MTNYDFSQSHFELFGLPPAFQLDPERLEHSYREIQLRVHPDKFAHLGEQERRLSMQWATHANEAYQTLKKPLSRARYLLHLHGVDTQEDTNTAMPPEFLMRQMEWREAIGEARESQDAAGLEHLHHRLTVEMREQQARLGHLLDAEKNYPEAAALVRELRFMEKLAEEVDRALEILEE
ncbi:MAG: Fe-S protein assembly co-chaperone HscB [Pseudomonadota bacterium]|jgi:molecular chaperone HscB